MKSMGSEQLFHTQECAVNGSSAGAGGRGGDVHASAAAVWTCCFLFVQSRSARCQ